MDGREEKILVARRYDTHSGIVSVIVQYLVFILLIPQLFYMYCFTSLASRVKTNFYILQTSEKAASDMFERFLRIGRSNIFCST